MFSVWHVCLYILRAWFNCAENGYRSGWKVAKLTNEETMGVSENSVPLHPMVNDHYPY